MTDYGRSLSFGLSLDPAAGSLDLTRRLTRQAENSGLDHLAVQDHPYQPGYLDTWTLISNLAAVTDRISFFTDVADLQLRPPTMLAKAAASLSVLTDGRIQLGVGGGAFAEAIASMGGTPRRGDQMVAFTEESLELMRRALAGTTVRLQSPHHSVTGYQAGPLPPRPVELWLGAQKRKMLAVTGRSADGWVSPLNIYVPPDEVPSRQEIIDEAATAAGRAPESIRRIYNVIGAIGAGGRGGQGLVGDVHRWVDTLTEWAVVLGFDTFVFWPTVNPENQLALFASEVAPAVREHVEAMRNGR
ncbi:LLM class flavin-dependent oxidoreductase [Streptomyces brasiliensis]|uniref:N5,N10-methylene tetrahydromethanopterin reductase n=1 Tax=Streptomyces brasiliensis TaxID=1954 RepID=A0A917KZG0_9ACTN|nr:LLM class flavin-dependent oxidoreductase [Streptomyces brasiliensis]GGJ34668.1 N5,N10-methylene tetrahydromethanopterin reductase [Streptomyces brasiliensis]